MSFITVGAKAPSANSVRKRYLSLSLDWGGLEYKTFKQTNNMIERIMSFLDTKTFLDLETFFDWYLHIELFLGDSTSYKDLETWFRKRKLVFWVDESLVILAYFFFSFLVLEGDGNALVFRFKIGFWRFKMHLLLHPKSLRSRSTVSSNWCSNYICFLISFWSLVPNNWCNWRIQGKIDFLKSNS